jgi:hypothetical protein
VRPQRKERHQDAVRRRRGEKQEHADAGGAWRLREGGDAGGENIENSLHIETPNARTAPARNAQGWSDRVG